LASIISNKEVRWLHAPGDEGVYQINRGVRESLPVKQSASGTNVEVSNPLNNILSALINFKEEAL